MSASTPPPFIPYLRVAEHGLIGDRRIATATNESGLFADELDPRTAIEEAARCGGGHPAAARLR